MLRIRREPIQENQASQLERALRQAAGRVGFEAVVPNPKPKLLDQVREVLRLRDYSNVSTTMIYTYVLRQGGSDTRSRLD